MEAKPLAYNGGYIALPMLTSSVNASAADADGGDTGSDITLDTVRSAKRTKTSWQVPMSTKAQRTRNPIRSVMEKISSQTRTTNQPLIPLSIGDPTTFGNLGLPIVLSQTMTKLLCEGNSNGYGVRA